MKRVLRWTGIVVGSLLAIAIMVYGVMYVLTERIVRRTYAFTPIPLAIPTDPDSIAAGRRLATLHGCFTGCHGKGSEGSALVDNFMVGRLVAPNLTVSVRKYSEAQLAGIVRSGIRPDGHSLWVMPSNVLRRMTDEELGRVIAFLKSLPASEGPGPALSLGPFGRWLVSGWGVPPLEPMAQLVTEAKPPPEPATGTSEHGHYLASTICAHCHGTDLAGAQPQPGAPDLHIVAAYSPGQFTTLLRTGEALGGRQLGEMKKYATDQLQVLSDADVADLYSYLHSMPAAGSH